MRYFVIADPFSGFLTDFDFTRSRGAFKILPTSHKDIEHFWVLPVAERYLEKARARNPLCFILHLDNTPDDCLIIDVLHFPSDMHAPSEQEKEALSA